MRFQFALAFFPIFSGYAINANTSNKSDIQELKQRVALLEEECYLEDIGLDEPTPFYIWGEGLYWKAAEGGLPVVNQLVTFENEEIVSKVKHVPSDWHWGFRVGADYNMCHDFWNIYATWTRYHFSDSKFVTLGPDRNPNILGLPNLAIFWVPTGSYNSIASRWRVHFDQADLQLSKRFDVAHCLKLIPHLGLRTAWVRQKFSYLARSLAIRELLVNFAAKSNFWGFGIVGGLDTNWELGRGFSIYGGLALSVLDGHFESPYKEILSGRVNSSTFHSGHQNMAVVVTDLSIGLRYDKSFYCDRLQLSFWALYEQHVYFEQNQFPNVEYSEGGIPFTDGSNLSMNGVTLGMGLGF